MIFLKDSIAQINYIGIEYSIESNFLKDMEFSKYHIFFFYIGVLHETTSNNDYGVLKINIINKLHAVLFVQMYSVLHGSILTNRQGGFRIFPSKTSLETFSGLKWST